MKILSGNPWLLKEHLSQLLPLILDTAFLSAIQQSSSNLENIVENERSVYYLQDL